MPEPTAKHPKGLYVLFSTEMWERFSFYSVQGMLALYLTKHFLWEKADATQLVSTYTACVYASPLIGGWLADRYLGYKKSVVIGGLFFILGHALFAGPTLAYTYAALVCLVIGNGFFKPNVSTMVGNLYPTTSKLKDAAFNIFYMGINIGACAAPVACELIQAEFGFHKAFNAAAIGMTIAMITFALFRKHLPDENKNKNVRATVAATEPDALSNIPEWNRIFALLLVCIVGIAFWTVFWQSNTTVTYWADENTDWKVSGIISNAINPGFVVLFAVPLNWIFKQLNRRGLEPSTPAKMTLGLFCCTMSSVVLCIAALSGGDTGKVSPAWLFVAYAFISAGELLLSAMGLSLVSKVAPPRFRGLLMGAWFLSLSIGGKLSVIGTYWTVWNHSTFFAVLAGISFAATAVLFVMLKFLRASMPGA